MYITKFLFIILSTYCIVLYPVFVHANNFRENKIFESKKAIGRKFKKPYLIYTLKEFNIKNSGKRILLPTHKKIRGVIIDVVGKQKSTISEKLTVVPTESKINLILKNHNGFKFNKNFEIFTNGNVIVTSSKKIKFDAQGNLQFKFSKKPGKISFRNQDLIINSNKKLIVYGGEIELFKSRINIPGGELIIGSFKDHTNLRRKSLFKSSLKKNKLNLNNIKLLNTKIFTDSTDTVEGGIKLYGENIIANNFTFSAEKKRFSSKPIEIFANNSILLRKGFITSLSFGEAQSGPVNIFSKGHLELNNVEITSETTVDSQRASDSNSISLETPKNLIIENSRISTSTFGSGNGGDINISANKLLINNKSKLTTGAQDLGDGGKLFIKATDVSIDDSEINAQTQAFEGGDGGEVELRVDKIFITNSGKISASSLFIKNADGFQNAPGNAGNIVIDARKIFLSGKNSKIIARSNNSSNAGDVIISTADFIISDQGEINVRAPQSSAGTIDLEVDNLILNNQSKITATTGLEKGNIKIKDAKLVFLNSGSNIETDARQSADGGNITISSALLIGNNNSNLVARAKQGNGGRVIISSFNRVIGFIENTQDSQFSNDIVVSSSSGDDGIIDFLVPVIDPLSGLTPRHITLSATIPLQQVCSPSNFNTQQNQFQIVRQSESTNISDQYISSKMLAKNWIGDYPVAPSHTRQHAHSEHTSYMQNKEAKSWKYLKNGDIELIGEKAFSINAKC